MKQRKNIWTKLGGVPYKAIVAYAIGIAMVISAAAFKYNSPVSDIIIEIEALPEGKNLITRDDVKSILIKNYKTNFVGWKLREVDVGLLEKEIEGNEFVREVQVYIDALNRLTIRIKQREPLLRVQDENGMTFYIDSEGYRLPTSRHYAARVRVATGHLPRFDGNHYMEAAPVYKSLFTASEALAADEFCNAYAEQIYVDQHGEFYLAPKVGKYKIRLGTIENIDSKLDNLKTFVKEVIPHQGWELCEALDLRFRDQIVCTKRNNMISVNNSIR
ncbi:MAG: hypothetical protein R3275_07845 [Saprospiraceae bacterium]|nr:hypothetical protein [Saprospiraceae bacterium]